MWDLFKALTVNLFNIPRYKDAEGNVNAAYDESSYQWRLKIVTILTVLTATVLVHMLDVSGLTPFSDGYANNMDVRDIQVQQLEQRLEKYYTALCMHPGQSELLDLIRDLQTKYQKLTGHRYQPLDCDLLLQLNA